ncbi:MAG: hypothetical protein LQ337_002406 [Flavoplaca oasis]|nr:MAG: hypothetical protein LQ337_002406 [Flavoplaca oasis]
MAAPADRETAANLQLAQELLGDELRRMDETWIECSKRLAECTTMCQERKRATKTEVQGLLNFQTLLQERYAAIHQGSITSGGSLQKYSHMTQDITKTLHKVSTEVDVQLGEQDSMFSELSSIEQHLSLSRTYCAVGQRQFEVLLKQYRKEIAAATSSGRSSLRRSARIRKRTSGTKNRRSD